MEAITSFLESVKERFNNPFIFSFVVVWIFHNWPITIGLFWLEPPTAALNHEYFYQHVSSRLNGWDCYWVPFFWAIGYTFGLPFLKLGNSAFSTWIGRKAEENDLKILNGSKISIDKFMNMRKELDQKKTELQDLITAEDQYRNDLMNLQSNFNDLNNRERKTFHEKIELESSITRSKNLKTIEGEWYYSESTALNSVPSKMLIAIKDGNVILMGDNGENHLLYVIHYFHHDERTNRINLVYFSPKVDQTGRIAAREAELLSFSELELSSTRMSGSEFVRGERKIVTYTRATYPHEV